MKRFFLFICSVFTLLFLTSSVSANSSPSLIERPSTGVYDPNGYLDKSIETKVKNYNEQHAKTNGTQIAVAIFDSLHGESIEEVSNTLARNWKIGYSGSDNGLLLLLAIEDREMRIETSNNVAAYYLTDYEAREILDAQKPLLREQNYTQAVYNMLTDLELKTKPLTDEEKQAIDEKRKQEEKILGGLVFGTVVAVVASLGGFGIQALLEKRKRKKRSQYLYKGTDKLYPYDYGFVPNDSWTDERKHEADYKHRWKRSQYDYNKSKYGYSQLYPDDYGFIDNPSWTEKRKLDYKKQLAFAAIALAAQRTQNRKRYEESKLRNRIGYSSSSSDLTTLLLSSKSSSSSSSSSSWSSDSWSGGGFDGGGSSSSW